MQLDIVALGEPLGEFNQTRPGEPDYRFGHGGDTSNVAIAAARQGAKVGYVTAVGDDAFGRSFLELWQREGVFVGGVKVDPTAHTGVYFVTHGPDGHEFSYLRAGSAASRLGPGDLPRDVIAAARLLHVSGISQAISPAAADAVFEAMAIARAAGATIAYDTNLRLRLWPLARARAVSGAAMALADIALPGLDDARQLTGLEQPDAIVDHYLALGCKIVALTLGKDGSLVATASERHRIPSISVAAIDATGAGDCFDGAFLAEWLRTGDAFAAGRYATVAAALSTTGWGAVAPLPQRAAVEAALGRGAA
ncbi:MAG: sugar kinase [Alphaproteobacteria bacterium]|nr:sugar kinase [Alphaproteobacteria bacterium]